MIGAVDAVYDRGALEAVNVGDRQGYVKLMQSLLGKSFRGARDCVFLISVILELGF